ncbi:hypothetical protein PO909_017519 [Leuciscus waleckii]
MNTVYKNFDMDDYVKSREGSKQSRLPKIWLLLVKTDSVARLMDMRSLLTLSVLLALIREDKGQKPAVFLLPRFPDVFAGDDVTLICKGRGEPIKWFINGDPQSHQGSSMLLTAVTSKNNGVYECERGGSKSDPYTLTVEELEPHAQLSPSIGGAVMSKGGGRRPGAVCGR